MEGFESEKNPKLIIEKMKFARSSSVWGLKRQRNVLLLQIHREAGRIAEQVAREEHSIIGLISFLTFRAHLFIRLFYEEPPAPLLGTLRRYKEPEGSKQRYQSVDLPTNRNYVDAMRLL